MSVHDSESRRFELNIWLSFSQADLGPTSAPGIVFSGFFWKVWNFFFLICAHSERLRNLLTGIFEIHFFFWQHRVSIVIGLNNSSKKCAASKSCVVTVFCMVRVLVCKCFDCFGKTHFESSYHSFRSCLSYARLCDKSYMCDKSDTCADFGFGIVTHPPVR